MPLTPRTSQPDRPDDTADSATTSLSMARPPTKKSLCDFVRRRVRKPTTIGRNSDSKKMVKAIKSSKLKVQAQIQGEQVRVTGKKRDDLQQVIALLRDADYGLPLQFQNFRD